MSRLAPVLASTTVIAVLICAHTWNQLRTERLLSADLQQRLSQLELAQVAPAPQPPTTDPAVSGNPVRAGGDHSVADQRQVLSSAPNARGTAPAPAGAPQAALYLQELMKDPDYREGMLASTRASLLQFYPDLAGELGVTPEQAGKMLDVLAMHDLDSVWRPRPTGQDDAARSEALKLWQENQRRQDTEIRALIGEAKFADWKEYEEQLGVRIDVGQLALALESSGRPLTEPQERQLVKTIAAEQKRLWEELPSGDPPSPSATLQERLAYSEHNLEFLEKKSQRILEASSAYLSQAQLGALRKIYDQQVKLRRAEQRILRAQSETGVRPSTTDTAATPR